jgi:hypothetical protein
MIQKLSRPCLSSLEHHHHPHPQRFATPYLTLLVPTHHLKRSLGWNSPIGSKESDLKPSWRPHRPSEETKLQRCPILTWRTQNSFRSSWDLRSSSERHVILRTQSSPPYWLVTRLQKAVSISKRPWQSHVSHHAPVRTARSRKRSLQSEQPLKLVVGPERRVAGLQLVSSSARAIRTIWILLEASIWRNARRCIRWLLTWRRMISMMASTWLLIEGLLRNGLSDRGLGSVARYQIGCGSLLFFRLLT